MPTVGQITGFADEIENEIPMAFVVLCMMELRSVQSTARAYEHSERAALEAKTATE